MAVRIWNSVRSWLGCIKRGLLMQRPLGLASLGPRSILQHPRRLCGRASIQIGKDTLVLAHSSLLAITEENGRSYRPSIQIGDGVYIGKHVYLTAIQGITLSDGCVLSEHVYITDLSHGFDPLSGPIMTQRLESKGPIWIGPNCFLGYRAAVMPGVTLGEWCIVGANSVVTRSFPAYSMIAGSPARLLKVYSHTLQQWVAPDALKSS